MNLTADTTIEIPADSTTSIKPTSDISRVQPDGRYAKYVLCVLILVQLMNFVDRSIISVLIEDIKLDLELTDAEIGFLGGAAFAIFYSTFGIALARLADVWNRKKLISVGLGFWSLMTVLCGFVKGFPSLAVCRFGVGIGESCASPSAISILYDYFSPKVRTTVLGISSCGGAIGTGLGIYAGGMILDSWNSTWPDAALAPFGLKGWQAAFIILGFPGLVLSLWVSTLREPVRGQSDGIRSRSHPTPFRESATVLMSMLPLCNLLVLTQAGGTMRAIAINCFALASIAAISYGLVLLTGDAMQWVAMAIGCFAVFSWAQILSVRDPVIFGMIFKCQSVRLLILGMAIVLLSGAVGFWTVPFFQRFHGATASEAGTMVGLGTIVFGVIGVVLGGYLADKLRTRTGKGKVFVIIASVALTAVSHVVLLTAESIHVAYGAAFAAALLFSLGQAAPMLSTLNDLVLPRGRATTSAFYIMLAALSAGALAPYVVGAISDGITAAGATPGDALRQGMLWSLFGPCVGLVLIFLSLKSVESDEANLRQRALELGEDPELL